MTPQAASKHFKNMEMIHKEGNWVLYELNGFCLLVNSCRGKDVRDFSFDVVGSELFGDTSEFEK